MDNKGPVQTLLAIERFRTCLLTFLAAVKNDVDDQHSEDIAGNSKVSTEELRPKN